MVKFVKLNLEAHIPTKGSKMAAGYDLYGCIPGGENSFVRITPHSTVKVGTGLAIQPPKGHFGAIFARSGLATKQGLKPTNCVGVADYDYTGEYIVAIHNDTDFTRIVRHGDRIAQLVFLPYADEEFVEVESLDETERGGNSFGGTGE